MSIRHRKPQPTSHDGHLAAADPVILTGHMGVVLTESRQLSWHLARLDLASHRMVFPATGGSWTPQLGANDLIDAVVRAAVEALDQRDPRLF